MTFDPFICLVFVEDICTLQLYNVQTPLDRKPVFTMYMQESQTSLEKINGYKR